MDDINIQQIECHIKKKNQQTKNSKKKRTVICDNYFFLQSELKVLYFLGDLQGGIFNNRFDFMTSYSTIQLGETRSNYLYLYDKISLQKEKQYYLLEYDNIENNRAIKWTDFMLYLPSIKLYLFHCVDSYLWLLDSLYILEERKICNISIDSSIWINSNLKSIIRNFHYCIYYGEQNIYPYIQTIITKISPKYKPLEFYVIHYLIIHQTVTLTFETNQKIIKMYIDDLKIWDFFSPKYKSQFQNECIEQLNSFINKSSDIIINSCLENIETWNNYQLSLLFLYFFGSLMKIWNYSPQHPVTKFSLLLSKNISPNPIKRENIENTRQKAKVLFEKSNFNWKYDEDCYNTLISMVSQKI